MENTNRDGHKLLFKGEEYRLDQILSLAKSGPPIEVKLEELNLLGVKKIANAREEAPYVAVHQPALQEYREGQVVFFKQEGKYTVLFGHDKLALAIDAGQTVFKGKLLSGPVLKRARIEKPISAAELAEQLRAGAETFNTPRFTERRPTTSYSQDRYKTQTSDRPAAPPKRGMTRPNTDPRNQSIQRGHYTGGLHKKS